MEISLIAAMANHRVIGKDNQMPWHLPADLKHFKTITMGKPIIMGRKTFESIGKPLPGRRNIVVTHQKISLPGCDVFHSIERALDMVSSEPEVMIIGGGEIFSQSLSLANRMYLTLVDADIEGDAFFPEWDSSEWQEVSGELHEADEKNPYPYRFVVLERVTG